MLQFIVTRLLNNRRVFFFAGMVFFFVKDIWDDEILQLCVFAFVASPLLIAITNGKSITIREYVGSMASWRNTRYSLFLLLVFLIVFLISGIAVYVGQLAIPILGLAVLAFTGLYTVFSPLLVKAATGEYRRLKGAGRIGFIALAVSLYVLFNYFLKMWHSTSPFIMVLTAFIGSLAILLTLCAVTAAAIAPDSP
jgi:hypothetical protein